MGEARKFRYENGIDMEHAARNARLFVSAPDGTTTTRPQNGDIISIRHMSAVACGRKHRKNAFFASTSACFFAAIAATNAVFYDFPAFLCRRTCKFAGKLIESAALAAAWSDLDAADDEIERIREKHKAEVTSLNRRIDDLEHLADILRRDLEFQAQINARDRERVAAEAAIEAQKRAFATEAAYSMPRR